MKRKLLEDMGLTKEQVDKILDENSQDIGKAKSEAEDISEKLKTAETEITALKNQLGERDSQLETLKKSTGDVADLKKQIETLQEENKAKDETHAAEIKQLKVDAVVNSALTAAKAKNITAAKALLKDLDKAELAEDGTVKGLSEQIDALVKADDTKFLFDTKTAKPKFRGTQPGQSGDNSSGEVDLSKMTYSELAAYMAENPNVKID